MLGSRTRLYNRGDRAGLGCDTATSVDGYHNQAFHPVAGGYGGLCGLLCGQRLIQLEAKSSRTEGEARPPGALVWLHMRYAQKTLKCGNHPGRQAIHIPFISKGPKAPQLSCPLSLFAASRSLQEPHGTSGLVACVPLFGFSACPFPWPLRLPA
jgi:hypothetical protein